MDDGLGGTPDPAYPPPASPMAEQTNAQLTVLLQDALRRIDAIEAAVAELNPGGSIAAELRTRS